MLAIEELSDEDSRALSTVVDFELADIRGSLCLARAFGLTSSFSSSLTAEMLSGEVAGGVEVTGTTPTDGAEAPRAGLISFLFGLATFDFSKHIIIFDCNTAYLY